VIGLFGVVWLLLRSQQMDFRDFVFRTPLANQLTLLSVATLMILVAAYADKLK